MLYSKEQADQITAKYTPEMFLGSLELWTGSGASLQRMAEDNMPKELIIEGIKFLNMHNHIHRPVIDYEGRKYDKVIVQVEYQSTEQVGKEWPVLQIGIRVWKTRGKIKAEIIRDGYIHKTKFW